MCVFCIIFTTISVVFIYTLGSAGAGYVGSVGYTFGYTIGYIYIYVYIFYFLASIPHQEKLRAF